MISCTVGNEIMLLYIYSEINYIIYKNNCELKFLSEIKVINNNKKYLIF